MNPSVSSTMIDNEFPMSADVVVIGGGIIGICTALFLAERGLAVVVCEKGHIAGEQSGRNWGWCRTMGRDPAEIPLAIESLKLWSNMNARTGMETGFRKSGALYLCENRRDISKNEEWLERTRPFQLESRLIGSADIDRLLPGSSRRWPAALYTASDGRAEPHLATAAIASAAVKRGARIIQRCAVRGIETSTGALSGVVTEHGPIRCSSAVVAGGAWSRLFCGNAGISFAQLKVLGSVLRTEPLDGAPEPSVGAGNFAFRKRLDGGYTIAQRNANIAPLVPDSFRLFFDFLPAAKTQWRELRIRLGRRFLEEWKIPRRWSLDAVTPFEIVRTLDPEPSLAILKEGMRNLTRRFPVFGGVKVAQRWAGVIDVTPDAVPVISPLPQAPGLFLASGFSGHGFGIGPGAGQLMADLVMGTTPSVDQKPYRYERL